MYPILFISVPLKYLFKILIIMNKNNAQYISGIIGNNTIPSNDINIFNAKNNNIIENKINQNEIDQNEKRKKNNNILHTNKEILF